MTARDILFIVVIPLALAEVGPWCGWAARRLLPWAARLRYGDTDRAAVRLEEWSGDLGDIPGQLTKLAYAAGQIVAGTAASARRKAKSAQWKTDARRAGDLNGQAVLFDAGQGAIAQLERSAFISALQGLPIRQREALVLHYYADLSEAQIAKMMGISRGAVRSHTARGMSALRAVLQRRD